MDALLNDFLSETAEHLEARMLCQRLPKRANVDPFRGALTRRIYGLKDRILSVPDLPALMAFSSGTRRMAGLASP
jgi:hypothetical protein